MLKGKVEAETKSRKKGHWTKGHLDIIIIIYSTAQEKVIDY